MAKRVQKSIKNNSKLIVQKSNDPRSYRQNSDRILKKSFKPKKKLKMQ